MYGFPQNSKFDILRDVSFVLAMKSSSAFHTILSAAATHMDAIHGRNPGRRAIWHRLEAIRLVNQQLADPVLSLSDNTIVTISSLMATEVSSLPMPQDDEMRVDQWVRPQRIWGGQGVAQTHATGLANIISRRGGLQTLRNSPRVEFHLYL